MPGENHGISRKNKELLPNAFYDGRLTPAVQVCPPVGLMKKGISTKEIGGIPVDKEAERASRVPRCRKHFPLLSKKRKRIAVL